MAGGVDSYGEVAAGLAIAERAACAPPFDKREPPVVVAGKRDREGWMVLAIIGGFQVLMPPAAARALAAEFVTYADLCEQRGEWR